jgi:hydrogen peroxide-dependent heme synthase
VENFGALPWQGHLILTFLMMVGRLEIYTVLLLFHPGLWRRGVDGWSGAYQLVGGGADVMFIHFRETFDELARAELRLRRSALGPLLRLSYDYTSVTEAGLYHATAEAAAQAKPGSKEFHRADRGGGCGGAGEPARPDAALPARAGRDALRQLLPHDQAARASRQLVRAAGRGAEPLMREHGLTGRNYAGRVFQVITGSTGFDDWEWGVTLFARDPLEFKRIVMEMRYDEASTRYGEFGEFFTGIRLRPDELAALFGG